MYVANTKGLQRQSGDILCNTFKSLSPFCGSQSWWDQCLVYITALPSAFRRNRKTCGTVWPWISSKHGISHDLMSNTCWRVAVPRTLWLAALQQDSMSTCTEKSKQGLSSMHYMITVEFEELQFLLPGIVKASCFLRYLDKQLKVWSMSSWVCPTIKNPSSIWKKAVYPWVRQ